MSFRYFVVMKSILACVFTLSSVLANPANAADSIWELHAELIAIEQETDVSMRPIVDQILSGGEPNQALQEIAQQERLKLETVQHELVEAYLALTESERADFIDLLSQRSESEILYYDFPPFSSRLAGIRAIRMTQAAQMASTGTGRALVANPLRPGAIPTSEISVDISNTVEINGSQFPANHFVLTFDDGPRPSTTRSILDSLQQAGVKANFFLTGNSIRGLSDTSELIPDMYSEGHGVENHSNTHAQMTRLSMNNARGEVSICNGEIERQLSRFAYRPYMFRFPYGSRNSGLKQMVREFPMTSIMWNIDTLDWKYKDPEVIIDLARSQIQARGRGIILMHDIHTQTALAVPHILQILAERKSTVSKLVPEL